MHKLLRIARVAAAFEMAMRQPGSFSLAFARNCQNKEQCRTLRLDA